MAAPGSGTGSGGASRPLLGNLAVLAVLALLAGALLTLHGGAWWPAAPQPSRWWLCALVVVAYAGTSAVFLWPRRASLPDTAIAGEPPLLVVWASQTGFASALAERSAAVLRDCGGNVLLLPLDQVDAGRLADTRRALFIASTTGEGDPPDHALHFLHETMRQSPALPRLQYALLALGDREYAHFCAFGRQLDEWLRGRGAQPLFDRVEVDNADEAALRHWQYELGRIADSADLADWSPPAYESWRLAARELLNPGSQGAPVHDLALEPATGTLPTWQAGDIAEIGPRNPPARVQALLDRLGLDGGARLSATGGEETLAALLARSQLPEDIQALPGLAPDALAAQLRPLPHREYSIASIPEEGRLRLLVREMPRADGSPGLGSGWLCRYAPLGGTIDLRLRGNPGFQPPPAERPLILVGNGTGIAGLRAHLRARIRAGARRNWLLFGERNADRDFFYRGELMEWRAQGWLERLDLAFSRDEGDGAYVQDRLHAAADILRDWVDAGACVLVCGNASGMAPGVDAAMAQALGEERRDALRIEGRYRRDVY
ncbi:sulfite reductase subunit alpha [Pseudoxanthomonas broegbernensis]|uniref:NADPH--hemoprotein reductase n=2 Tax=Pseudoxanthomonas broegbernensis TaxID=83619 RepID=A0A7V8GK94_9GAMM|nr:sulfite reductase subunit alpha [Pseudoxanthomonas broegbernensis]